MNRKLEGPTRKLPFSNLWHTLSKLQGITELSALAPFAKQMILNPRSVGAACPSSRKLARVMASFIPQGHKGVVVELGAGTGAITAAILERGIAPERLVAIERSPELIDLLKKRFPKLCIVSGDAQFLDDILNKHIEKEERPVKFVISGLPLRSLPKAIVRAIEQQLELILSENGRFIQFTYDFRPDMSGLMSEFVKCDSRVVLQNLPPARVDVYKRKV
jgi:phosphatidylethanolamine/phosphatidyl-N-methylethanolamine N-methyltransferase